MWHSLDAATYIQIRLGRPSVDNPPGISEQSDARARFFCIPAAPSLDSPRTEDTLKRKEDFKDLKDKSQ